MIEVKNSHTSIDKSFKNPESRCPFRKPDFAGTESNRPAFGPPTVLWETTQQLIGKKSLHTSAHAPELSSACSSTLDAKTDNLKTAKAGEFYAVKNLEACHESDESRLTLGNWPVIARHLCLHNVRFPMCLTLNLAVALQYINIGIISLTSTGKYPSMK